MDEKNEKINYFDVKSDKFQPNDVMNILMKLKEQNDNVVWHEIVLPSSGKCGYNKVAKIREISTQDEKIFIKELYTNKEKAITNLLSKCCKIFNDSGEEISLKNLTNFDQTYILIELSTITFPGPKDYELNIEDEKVKVVADKTDLLLETVPNDLSYPMSIRLPLCDLTFFLKFVTVEVLDRVEKIMKEYKDDPMMRMLSTVATITEKVTIGTGDVEIRVDTWYDYVRILQEIKPEDLKILAAFLNDNIVGKYGYKLTKTIYLPNAMRNVEVELEPLNFFRISV